MLAALVEDAIAEHEVLLARRPLFARAADASRLGRWSAARTMPEAERAEDPDLFELDVRGAALGALDLAFLYVADSWLQSVALRGARLDGAILQDCDFWESDLAGTSWRDARVVRCAFQACALAGACLDDATFVDCVLFGSDLSGVGATARGAQFIRCDLRRTAWQGRLLANTRFDRCQLHGIAGRPIVVSVEIERPDLTRAGDGSYVGTARDVLGMWR
jgi:uncharacterized protein YjbI with pentapeptide repeats